MKNLKTCVSMIIRVYIILFIFMLLTNFIKRIYMISKNIVSLLILAFAVSCSGQSKVKNPLFDSLLNALLLHNVPEITVHELNVVPVVYLDAREQKEYDVSHVLGAIWVGYNDFQISRVEGLPRASKIVVYCSVGYRSEIIALKLLEDGFVNVSNLYGGIFEWVNVGNTVVNQYNFITTKVHVYSLEWGVWLDKGDKVY